MFELRKLNPEDVIEIKDNLVEGQRGLEITSEFAQAVILTGPAYTYLKDGNVVACCGAINQFNGWYVWTLVSKGFSCFTRARAIMAFKTKLFEIGGIARIGVPSDLPNGRKYAEFLGGKFIGTEASRLFRGITNSIFEVA